MTRIALVTCRVLPEPDPDQELLLDALTSAGMDAALVAWDDPAADRARCGRFDACILRSTWNYHERPDDFLAWVDRTATVSRLYNPREVVRWNLHKRYLAELERAGVPVVPTAWFDRGEAADLGAACRAHGWIDVVVKPAVSAGSFATRRFGAGEESHAQRFLEGILRERDAMVQPVMAGFEDPGERAVVWIDGRITHAVRKEPRFADGEERVSGAMAVTDEEHAIVERALSCVRGPLLYARIDTVAGIDGTPVVSELELIEPSLFLLQNPRALERFVDAIARAAGPHGKGVER